MKIIRQIGGAVFAADFCNGLKVALVSQIDLKLFVAGSDSLLPAQPEIGLQATMRQRFKHLARDPGGHPVPTR
jgi:hypothetical protein